QPDRWPGHHARLARRPGAHAAPDAARHGAACGSAAGRPGVVPGGAADPATGETGRDDRRREHRTGPAGRAEALGAAGSGGGGPAAHTAAARTRVGVFDGLCAAGPAASLSEQPACHALRASSPARENGGGGGEHTAAARSVARGAGRPRPPCLSWGMRKGGWRRRTPPWRCAAPPLPSEAVRRPPTLPHPPACSTMGAIELSFPVRIGTVRFRDAMTAV